MIQKWKTILTNWINCYSCDNEKRQQNISLDNLLHLFTHIQESLKLDNSKSSNFEAGTLQVFIKEKYPEFKFENGNLEATNDEEVYTIASLLLFFICVNSKNDDIKRVMCNKLSVEDQETILKFSKCLMDCSPILYTDVEAAISEACGAQAAGSQVAETPPALRSLHGEVRRLQAALDAERFDRNYLQDELARTQLKLDRLTKEKEQCKLEILNLKAKISLCCGEDREASSQARADDSRLQKQLQELEARLDSVQGRLDDVEDERDAYKKKIEDLKHERDKWLSLSQEETFRAGQLTDQLETERRTVQSLKDLVSELRQHNRNNGLDASMLECDDPDTSIQSLHNTSVCSEACANVVEVQLGEERAKIEVLKQQMQGLQDQLAEVNQKLQSEKLAFAKNISEKEKDVSNLKHRINEEIAEKNNLNSLCNQEIAKLNDKISELTQTIIENEERAQVALEEKMHEIKSLQQHLAEETKKSGNIIKNLKIELEAEKFAQLKLKDDCDSRIMKLNEKILNRNNELVELQNNIIKKSEMIEIIQADLRKEKELRDELSNSCNNQLFKLNEQRIAIENTVQEKCYEISEYQNHLQKNEQCIEELNKTVAHVQSIVVSLEEKCQHKDGKIVEKQKEIEFLNDVYQKEQEKLTYKLDERNATIKSLQMQLENEIEYKIQLQSELAQLQTSKMSLVDEVNDVKTKSKADLLEKEYALGAVYDHLKEETKLKEDLIVLCEKRHHELRLLEEEVSNKEYKIQLINKQLDTETKLLREELMAKVEMIESINRLVSIEQKEKSDLQELLNTANDEKGRLETSVTEKDKAFSKLKNAYEKLCRDHHDNKENLKTMEAKLKDEVKKNEQLQDSNEKNTSKLLLKLEKTEKSIKKIQLQSKSILDGKELQVQSLTLELSDLKAAIECEREMVTLAKKEKEALEETLNNEVYFKNRLESEYQKKCKTLEDTITNFKQEIASKNKEIYDCNIKDAELNKLSEQIVLKNNELKILNKHIQNAIGIQEEQVLEKDDIIKAVKNKLKSELSEKENLQSTLESLNKINANLVSEIKEKCEELCELQVKYDDLSKKSEENESSHQSEKQYFISVFDAKENELLHLNNNLATEIDQKTKLKALYDEEIVTLNQTIKELRSKFEEEIQERQAKEQQLIDDKLKLENTIKNLEIEVDAEKISKIKLKEDNENLVSKLNKKITNISNELLQLQNNVIENNKKTELLLSDYDKEKVSKDNLLKKCDEEIVKLNETKLILEKESHQKMEEFRKLRESLEEKNISIEQLHKEIDDLRSYCTELQKDKKTLEDAKMALITVVDDRDRKILEFESAETVLASIVNNLESQLKGISDKLQNKKDIAETTENELRNEISANTNLKNSLISLQEDLSEKLKEIIQLKEENEQLRKMTSETESTVEVLQTELKEKSMEINQLIESSEAESSKLNSLVQNLKQEIKKKEMETQQLENIRANLQKDITKQKESLIIAQKDIEILEKKYDEEYKLKDKFQKECENQRVMLNGITEKLNQNVIVQNNEAIEMTKEIQSLRKTVEQKCEELRIAEENICIQTKAIADLTTTKETEIENLNKKVGSLQSLNTDLDQELKNEADRKMQIIEALQKDNEQLQYIIEEENSTHEIMLKEKDKFIEELDEKLKYVNIQLEDIRRDYEDKTLMWEKLKIDAEEKIQNYEVRIEKLEEENTRLMKEIEALKETLAETKQEKSVESKHTSWEKDTHGLQNQVDTTTSDLTHSSMESLKTISDLEKIIQDKNRKITAMQTEITYIKSAIAESGLKLIDTTKELEVSRDTCEELSTQLRKIVQQKNEEIADLKRQVTKMSVTENRASQIIKVSAKYQAMILKRIAEIKSTAVLKELTNFGNTNTKGDSELRRSLTAGSITMEDLESFLETTDRHLKRCSEKQIALQKDRDRLSEVNRINESEIINMKKFLTEMSLSFRTFTTVKDVYSQKLSKIVSIQRMVRRDVLSLDGHITEATMCKLERGYAAVMQDLSECAMNIERWVDRSVSRMFSQEKIKQAFTSDIEQPSLSTANYQNAAIEVQLSELENSFQKLLGEIGRAQKGEGARSSQEVTIMEVRAEYEDKLNRMKAKMKELFHEEMGRLKLKQSEEIAALERELVKSREKLAESSRAYEEHIRALTTELWSVGEKFLVKKEEADWLRKKQSGSLMSLQHVHSSGLHVPKDSEVIGRPSDTISLRSLPMHSKQKTESRGLHMSDEEGEVFDNRFLKELSATPRASLAPGQRISELKRRNSLVPPHLKSSYPAEMQFAPILDEEDIKCASNSTLSMGRQQRKEVGITAYKKPGPPTPSKQAGRLSATDAELRESLRVESDPHASRKTSTPSRLRSLFRSHKNDVDEGTPRSRRFSSIFRKK